MFDLNVFVVLFTVVVLLALVIGLQWRCLNLIESNRIKQMQIDVLRANGLLVDSEADRLRRVNAELAGATNKHLPPRLPALYTTWVCAKAPEIGDPPKALENAVGTSWRVDGLRRVEDPCYHVVTLVGLSEGFNATSLHVPLEMFRSHFSRPDTAHKDS
jgi:hypothetical protein